MEPRRRRCVVRLCVGGRSGQGSRKRLYPMRDAVFEDERISRWREVVSYSGAVRGIELSQHRDVQSLGWRRHPKATTRVILVGYARKGRQLIHRGKQHERDELSTTKPSQFAAKTRLDSSFDQALEKLLAASIEPGKNYRVPAHFHQSNPMETSNPKESSTMN